ncbi:adenylyltransferase/cytidyltransferase family protein [Candidatus Parcubacteria bacterium]|nr:adenylyltransferase/cytidyltransferase family protein [Candidatus Parcubacteria bacterium]
MEHITHNKIMVFGTFDVFHKGHKNFLGQARKFGDYLIVVIARDKNVKKIKGEFSQNSEQERLVEIKRSRLASEAVLGSILDKYKIIKKYRPDIICLGYDQKIIIKQLKEKLKEFNLLNTKVIRLKAYQTKKYKSSKFKMNNLKVC